jgi:flagellar basal body-associated protein FliL
MLRVQALSSNADNASSSSGGLSGASLFILVAVVGVLALTGMAALVVFIRRKRQPGEPRTETVSSTPGTHSVHHSEHRVISNPLYLVDDSPRSETQQTLAGKTQARPSIAESSIDTLSGPNQTRSCLPINGWPEHGSPPFLNPSSSS